MISNRKDSFVGGVLAGLAATAKLFETPRYTRTTGTDLERIRGDVRAVGGDFRVVIEKQHDGKPKKSSQERIKQPNGRRHAFAGD